MVACKLKDVFVQVNAGYVVDPKDAYVSVRTHGRGESWTELVGSVALERSVCTMQAPSVGSEWPPCTAVVTILPV